MPRATRCSTSSTAAAARTQLRRRTGLAARARAPRAGPTSPRRPRSRQDRDLHAMVEAARVVVDAQLRRMAVLAEWLSAVFDYNTAPFFQSSSRSASKRTDSSCGPTACTVGCAGATSIARRPQKAVHPRRGWTIRRVVVPSDRQPAELPPKAHQRPTAGLPKARKASADRIPSRVLGAPHLRGRVVRGHRALDLGGRRRAQPAVRTRRLRILMAHAERRHWCLTTALHALVPEVGARITIAQVRYLSVASIGLLWMIFASGYARIAWAARNDVRAALWVVPVVSIVGALTNSSTASSGRTSGRSTRGGGRGWCTPMVRCTGPTSPSPT